MKVKEFGKLKVAYREGTCDEDVIRECFIEDVFFKNVPEYHLKSNHTIIDIGGHIGAFSMLAASKLKKGKVYSVEPSRDSYEFLKKNALLNNLSNIFIYNLALTDYKGTARLYHNLKTGSWGDTIAKNISNEYEDVKTDTLDNFMKDNNITRCDFMKMNCEGSEFQIILNSPIETLQKINTILILYHLDRVSDHSEYDLISHLRTSGFWVKVKNKTKNRGWIIGRKKYIKWKNMIKIGDALFHILGCVKKKRQAFEGQ